MSKRARQMPDQNHSFAELRQYWSEGRYTLEECVTQMLHAIIRLDKRKAELTFKMLSLKEPGEKQEPKPPPTLEELEEEMRMQSFIESVEAGNENLHEVMDMMLDSHVRLEVEIDEMERQVEEILRLQNQLNRMN